MRFPNSSCCVRRRSPRCLRRARRTRRAANNHCLKTTGDICHVAPKSHGVCFATFSGDLAPALLTLGAEVDLAGPAGRRTLPLDDLYIGYARHDTATGDGKNYLALKSGEFVTAVRANATP